MTLVEIQGIAKKHGFGSIDFDTRIAINTGRVMVCGYVTTKDGSRELFCKFRSEGGYYLCNQFRELQ